jgi:tetratricopeptide (TPR) repeat protein
MLKASGMMANNRVQVQTSAAPTGLATFLAREPRAALRSAVGYCLTPLWGWLRAPSSRDFSSLYLLIALLVGVSNARADDSLSRYFEGLRSRQLYTVAEGEALRRLNDPRTDPELLADLTAELSRTLLQHAGQSAGDEQAELLKQAEQVVADFLAANPTHSRIALVRLQQARIPAAWGGTLAWRADVFQQDAELRREAITALNSGIEQLREAEDMLDREAEGEQIGIRERGELKQEASRALARALIQLGNLTPAGSHQTAAWGEAEERLFRLEERTHDADRQYEYRLSRMSIARMRGERNKVESLAQVLQRPDVPLGIQQSAVSELLRADLELGDVAGADTRMREAERLWSGAVSSELLAMKFEVTLSLYQLATKRGETGAAEPHRQQLEQLLNELTGPWGERSRILWEHSSQLERYGPELAEKVDAARAAYAAGDWQQAADGFGEAIALAESRQQLDYAVEAAFTQGTILIEHEQWIAAAVAYGRVDEVHSESTRAADADLMRAWCLGRAYQAQPTEVNRLAYGLALEQHRTRFPDSQTVAESAWMQGVLEESRLQWTIALRLYRLIPEEHPRAEAAHLRIAHLHGRIIDRIRELGHDASEWEDDALDELGEIISQWPPAPALLSPPQSDLMVQTARLAMAHRERGYDIADELLMRVVESIESAKRDAERLRNELDPAWETIGQSAMQLRIVSLAGQGRADEAQRLLDSLSSDGSPVALLRVLTGLSEMGAGMNIAQIRDLGRLQLQTALRLEGEREQLSENEQRELDVCLAQALSATGNLEGAVEAWQALVAADPRNALWLEQLAMTHQSRQTREAWTAAKQTWRQIEALHPEGSEAWLSARWHIADCCVRLDEDDEARRLIGVTRVLYPELGGETLRERFEALEEMLD